mmetsp:Transcript_2135/g.8499  ORF Transcript_2135/g.8499 Transcript_2135/m.8499 type:complete len:217 (-) Transcript_2135:475-1125(-)
MRPFGRHAVPNNAVWLVRALTAHTVGTRRALALGSHAAARSWMDAERFMAVARSSRLPCDAVRHSSTARCAACSPPLSSAPPSRDCSWLSSAAASRASAPASRAPVQRSARSKSSSVPLPDPSLSDTKNVPAGNTSTSAACSSRRSRELAKSRPSPIVGLPQKSCSLPFLSRAATVRFSLESYRTKANRPCMPPSSAAGAAVGSAPVDRTPLPPPN